MIKMKTPGGRGLFQSARQLRFGFSPGGLLAFALVMLPNLLWLLAPPLNDPLAANSAPSALLELLEHASQWVLVATLVLLVNREKGRRSRVFLFAAALPLAGYYALWAAYYAGMSPAWLLLGLAVLTPLFFCLAAVWLKNWAALPPAVVFGIAHIAVTCSNYLT